MTTHPSAIPKISSVCLPSCNRPEALERGLGSYLENFERYGRQVSITVADDSRALEVRHRYREVLRGFRQRFSADFFYIGLEEKLRYIKRLITENAAPPSVIKFAFFDSEQTGLATYGGNRNFLLLHHVGQLFLSVDDDTVCRIAEAPGFQPDLKIIEEERFSSSHPCECWVYPTQQELLASLNYVETDFIGLHEMMLGREVNEAVDCLGKQFSFDLDPTRSDAISLNEEQRRILVTFNGLAGDCATPSPTNYLLFIGESFRRLVANEADYNKFVLSRQILRVADRFIISRRTTNTPGLFTGLDHRDFLPPYIPVGRGEDLVYWNILERTVDSIAFGYLPWSLLHMPVDLRTFWPGEIGRSASGVSLDVFLAVLIRSWKGAPGGTSRERLQKLGEYLGEISKLPSEEFDRFTLQQAEREMQAFIEHLEGKLRDFGNENRQWIQDQQRFIETARKTHRDHTVSIPLDVLYGRSFEDARRLVQRLIGQIGEMFCWWPALSEAARGLQQKGFPLAQALHSPA